MSEHEGSGSGPQASIASAGGSSNPQRDATTMPAHRRKDSKVVEGWRRHNRWKSGIEGAIEGEPPAYPALKLNRFLREQSAPARLQQDPPNAGRHKRKLSELNRPPSTEAPKVPKEREASLHSLAGSLAELESQKEEEKDRTRWKPDDLKSDTGHLFDSTHRLFNRVRGIILRQVEWFDYVDYDNAIKKMVNAHDAMYTDEIKIKFMRDEALYTPEFRQDMLTLHEELRICLNDFVDGIIHYRDRTENRDPNDGTVTLPFFDPFLDKLTEVETLLYNLKDKLEERFPTETENKRVKTGHIYESIEGDDEEEWGELGPAVRSGGNAPN